MPRNWPRIALRAMVFLVSYLATIELLHGHGLFAHAVLWLPTGVAVAGLWLLGWRYWPVIAVGTLVHRLIIGYMFPNYLPAVIGTPLEALTAVAILRRLGFRQEMRRLRDGLALLAAAIVAPAVSATIGRINWLGAPAQDTFWNGWSAWWRMNALGLLVVAPLVLSWAGLPRPRLRLRTLAEAAALTAGVCGAIWLLVSFPSASGDSSLGLTSRARPGPLYAALRFGVRGAATAAAAVAILLTLGTAYGFGPFVIHVGAALPDAPRELALQALIGIATATPLLLGALVAERAAALARVDVERGRHQELLTSIDLTVNEGLFRISLNRGLVYVNSALARMLGHASPEPLLGRSHVELFADPARAEQLRAAVLARGQVLDEEVLFVRPDGSALQALVSCTIVRGADGRVEHCDGAVTDITARRRLEEQLRQTQKMEALGKLAGGVSHDFNNLLTVILGHGEDLRTSLPRDSAGRAHAEEIAAAAARAARLTQQLLAYSRRQVLEPEVLGLRDVIDQLTRMLQRLIGEDVRLVTRHAAAELFVRADRGQIEQVLLNLVINARDAMPGGGTVTIETGPIGRDEVCASGQVPGEIPAGPLVCLSVRDTGVGMDAAVMRQAFDPFFTTKEPGRGTGLGLSTVYGIVRQSGGLVWIESAPDAGTTVRVCLPRIAAAATTPAAAATPAAPATTRASGTVLVAEDEAMVRNLIVRTLEGAGYQVLEAEDGQHALEVLRRARRRPDLVVTDAVMPRMGGRELITRLTAEWPGLRTLLVSGYATEAPGPGDPADAASAYLQKPFTPSTLLASVRACIAAERALR